jgi:hypothetical protein
MAAAPLNGASQEMIIVAPSMLVVGALGISGI